MRGRVHRLQSVCLLCQKSQVWFGRRNLPGVDVVVAKDLNAETAPGGDVGRLTVFKISLENLTEVIIMNAYDIIIQPWLTKSGS